MTFCKNLQRQGRPLVGCRSGKAVAMTASESGRSRAYFQDVTILI